MIKTGNKNETGHSKMQPIAYSFLGAIALISSCSPERVESSEEQNAPEIERTILTSTSIPTNVDDVVATDLKSEDPIKVLKGVNALSKVNQKFVVGDLISVILNDTERKHIATSRDVLRVPPFAQAIITLSEKVPDPPTTHLGFEPSEDDIEPWLQWWENNRGDYEGSSDLIPPPREGSLRLLSKEEMLKIEGRRVNKRLDALEEASK